MPVLVVPPDPQWSAQFLAEADRIRSALGDACIEVHHIGSTSIPEIYAKPIIDILLEVVTVADLDKRASALTAIGYEAKGEFGIPGRRYFPKNSVTGTRTHQIHAFASRSDGLNRHLAFRDYMIAHPPIARAYSELKRELASRFLDDIEAYMDGKDPFIKEHENMALKWLKEAKANAGKKSQ